MGAIDLARRIAALLRENGDTFESVECSPDSMGVKIRIYIPGERGAVVRADMPYATMTIDSPIAWAVRVTEWSSALKRALDHTQ